MRVRAFLLGAVAGALGGLLVVEFGLGLPFLGPLAIVTGIAARPRPLGAAGSLMGWGAIWVALFVSAARGCSVDRNCGDSPPSVAPWIALGVTLVAAGFALLAWSRRSRPAR